MRTFGMYPTMRAIFNYISKCHLPMRGITLRMILEKEAVLELDQSFRYLEHLFNRSEQNWK